MISVCVTSHNGEKYIAEQLNSILNQISSNDEVIVSDDCSTDNTLRIIQEIDDPRITILHHQPYTKHSFPLDKCTHNFEYALQHAHGDIIFLCDQDDVWLEGKVKKCVEALQAYDFVITDCIVTDSALNMQEKSYFRLMNTNLNPCRNIIKCSWLGCCMAFRKEVLKEALPFPETNVGHDLWLGLIATKRFRVTMLREPLLLYRRHAGTSSPAGSKTSYSLSFRIRYRLSCIKSLIKKLYF